MTALAQVAEVACSLYDTDGRGGLFFTNIVTAGVVTTTRVTDPLGQTTTYRRRHRADGHNGAGGGVESDKTDPFFAFVLLNAVSFPVVEEKGLERWFGSDYHTFSGPYAPASTG